MRVKYIKPVPVMHDGKLVGIVARSDLIRAFANKLEEQSKAAKFVRKTVNEARPHAREGTVPPPTGSVPPSRPTSGRRSTS
jgi:hypothetical protein